MRSTYVLKKDRQVEIVPEHGFSKRILLFTLYFFEFLPLLFISLPCSIIKIYPTKIHNVKNCCTLMHHCTWMHPPKARIHYSPRLTFLASMCSNRTQSQTNMKTIYIMARFLPQRWGTHVKQWTYSRLNRTLHLM